MKSNFVRLFFSIIVNQILLLILECAFSIEYCCRMERAFMFMLGFLCLNEVFKQLDK